MESSEEAQERDLVKATHDLVHHCVEHGSWPKDILQRLVDAANDPDEQVSRRAARCLFGLVAEGLSDQFEPRLCDVYARIFSHVVASTSDALEADELYARYQRIRHPRRFDGNLESLRTVFVLSRVTLGADVAITSTILDAAKRLFPKAEVVLVAPEKNWDLFSGDRSLSHLSVRYQNDGTLRDRVSVRPSLQKQLSIPNSIVIDPDSRLTQLGLLPVCPEPNYYFFESRSYGGSSEDSLYRLIGRWLSETFGATDPQPFVNPAQRPALKDQPITAISFGVGGNLAKRVPDPFEAELLKHLLQHDGVIYVDCGAGGDEKARVQRAIERAGDPNRKIRKWEGSFSSFADVVSRSRLFVGYDSAAQHVAAVSGVPMVTVFTGFPNRRMFARWRPVGNGPMEVIALPTADPQEALRKTVQACEKLSTVERV